MGQSYGGIKIFIERGKFWAALSKALTLPLVSFSVLTITQLYLQTKLIAQPNFLAEYNLAQYLTILGILLSTSKNFLNIYATAFALGVVSFCTYIYLNEFNVSRRDMLFLIWLAIPPMTVLFAKSL